MPAPLLSQDEFTNDLADFCHQVATGWFERGEWTKGDTEPPEAPALAVA